jgi:phospholipase/carboxylesterase
VPERNTGSVPERNTGSVPERNTGSGPERNTRSGSERDRDPGRLLTPPERVSREPPAPGLQALGLDEPRDGLIYVPAGYEPGNAAPLVLMLHGAGGDPRGGLGPFLGLADDHGLILVAPASRRETWDRVLGGYGPDVRTADRALALTFGRLEVDRSKMAVAGFSDGASYALSLGMANGDLFTHVIAFSPGFAAPGSRRGKPGLFVTHGVHDDVLPISATSRRILRDARRDGYDVRYREFDGGHTVPAELAEEAVRWFLEDRG